LSVHQAIGSTISKTWKQDAKNRWCTLQNHLSEGTDVYGAKPHSPQYTRGRDKNPGLPPPLKKKY
jgi:hypothetical protein